MLAACVVPLCLQEERSGAGAARSGSIGFEWLQTRDATSFGPGSIPVRCQIPVRCHFGPDLLLIGGGHHHGERLLRAADTLLRGVFAGTIKAGPGVMTHGLSDGAGRFSLRVFPANRDHRQSTFFGSLL